MKPLFLILIAILILSCNNTGQSVQKSKNQQEEILPKLEKALDKEQEIRKQTIEAIKDGKPTIALERQMHSIDSTNLILANQYLKTNGWPKQSIVGDKVSSAVFHIIQHSDHHTMKTYLPLLEKEAYNGEAKKMHYAMMKDRVLTDSNLPQIYGTQCVPRKDENGYITSEYYVWPIENNLIVDSLRKEMGFKTTISSYAKSMDAEYDVEEKLPNL